MRFNRSVPPCTVIPVLIYPDPGAAADWLSQAFGFTARLRIANHRIQMKAGDGCFTIAEGTVAPNNSHIIQVRIENAEAHCERARQNGAIILPSRKTNPTASANTTLRTFAAIAGTSPKLLPTWRRRNGAAVRFILSESILVRFERPRWSRQREREGGCSRCGSARTFSRKNNNRRTITEDHEIGPRGVRQSLRSRRVQFECDWTGIHVRAPACRGWRRARLKSAWPSTTGRGRRAAGSAKDINGTESGVHPGALPHGIPEHLVVVDGSGAGG